MKRIMDKANYFLLLMNYFNIHCKGQMAVQSINPLLKHPIYQDVVEKLITIHVSSSLLHTYN